MTQQVVDEARRQRLLAAERIVQASAVQGPYERSQHQPRDRALVAMAVVGREDEVGLVLEQGAAQPIDPVRSDRHGVGLHQHQPPRAQSVGDGERRPQGGGPTRHAVEGHVDALAGRRLVLDHDGR
jgi:hypothetical protein